MLEATNWRGEPVTPAAVCDFARGYGWSDYRDGRYMTPRARVCDLLHEHAWRVSPALLDAAVSAYIDGRAVCARGELPFGVVV